VTVTGFALQLIQTVVWPVTIVTLAVLLRRSLANLISRFQEGEFPGVKVRFTGESIQPGILSEVTFRAIRETGRGNVAEAEGSDSEVRLIFALATESAETDADKKLSDALRLTGSNPTAAVLTCASVLETAVKILYGWRFVSPPGGDRARVPVAPEDPIQALDTLFQEGDLVEPTYRSARSMFEFRNEILNGKATDRASAALFLDAGRRSLTSILTSRYFFESNKILTEKIMLVTLVRRPKRNPQKSDSYTDEGDEY